MINFLRNLFTDNEVETMSDNRATIRQMKNGKFRLLSGPYGNEVVATYARRRDALRGATRRGFTVTA